MSPYRDQDLVDIEGEFQRLHAELLKLRHDIRRDHELMADDMRRALEPRQRWWSRPPSAQTFCFALAVAVTVASTVARAVCP